MHRPRHEHGGSPRPPGDAERKMRSSLQCVRHPRRRRILSTTCLSVMGSVFGRFRPRRSHGSSDRAPPAGEAALCLRPGEPHKPRAPRFLPCSHVVSALQAHTLHGSCCPPRAPSHNAHGAPFGGRVMSHPPLVHPHDAGADGRRSGSECHRPSAPSHTNPAPRHRQLTTDNPLRPTRIPRRTATTVAQG